MKDNINNFLDYIIYEKKYSSNTETSYEIDLYKFKEYIDKNNKNYLKINYQTISDFIIELKKTGYNSTSINRIISTLRSFYRYLEKTKQIDNNPLKLITNLKTEKRLPNYFKYDEFIKMLEVLEDNPLDIRNRLIIELFLSTGARISEITNIKISDIDINNNEIKIKGKGNKERIVYFSSYCKKALLSYINNSRKILLKNKASNYLFINNLGNPLTARGIRLIIDTIVKKAAVSSKVTPHTFRHTFATMLLNEGCSIKSVQELLGHANLSTTGIYTHLTNDELRKVYLKTHPRAKE